jgi:AcrR family transcriptional regulator
MSRVREEGIEERILDSAFKVFGECGFADATIKEIAEGVGLSSGSLYTYFDSKEELFRASVKRVWANFMLELSDIAERRLGREERSSLLLERGFDALIRAFPLVKGIFLEACRLDLIEEDLDRVCDAMGDILGPDESDPLRERWLAQTERRKLMMRVIVLGVLTTAALAPRPESAELGAQLRQAMTGLIAKMRGELDGQGSSS